MPDIEDGESVEVKGSAKEPYILKNIGGVYSCTCPAWRTQSLAIERRTCKHLRKYRGDQAEIERLGGELPVKAVASRRKAVARASGTGSGISGASATGEEVAADIPGFLLAHAWDNYLDLTGWWMSEKLDGVRAYWDGKQFISRQGNVYMAPDWFVEDLPPDIHLDGELWIARKAFQKTVSIVRRQDKNKEWEAVKYVVFDAPQVDDVFEARMAYLQQLLDEIQPRYARPHEQERCKSSEHLLEELKRVESFGGEGLMLRQPQSKYEQGRSSTLLKVKTFHDADARVLEHLPGTGKHKGRMGALSVELSDGTRFAIGTGFSDKERSDPPPVGSIVTFRYQELTDRGVPRFPSFVRMRTDIDRLPDPSQKGDTAIGASAVQVSDDGNQNAGKKGAAKTKDTTNGDQKPAPEEEPAPVSNVVSIASGKPLTEDNAQPAGSESGSKKSRSDSTQRYFEFVEGSSSKFWSIFRIGSDVTVNYGRIGTEGIEKTKSFKDEAAARKYFDDIIEEKTGKGYIEKRGPGGDEVDDDDFDDDSEDAYDDEDEDGEPRAQRSLSVVGEMNFAPPGFPSLSGFSVAACYCSDCRPQLAGSKEEKVEEGCEE